MSDSRKELFEEFEDAETAYGYLEEFQNIYIASQIKALRKQRGWTQEQLGSKAGMKQTRIHKLEDVNYDSWSIKTLRRLAEAFDVGLRVSFESVGTMINDIVNMDEQSLRRTSRADEINARKRARINYERTDHTDSTTPFDDYVSASYGKEENINDEYRTGQVVRSETTPNSIYGGGGTENDLR